ncbi:thermonuclease family protein [Mameliella alba]|uniref:thermonuclease family protein n=1 Tax=Mameliella alba TaxID=561184 RepID=UPI00185AA5D4|nr:thermonuclease family protein [Mameliella alba]
MEYLFALGLIAIIFFFIAKPKDKASPPDDLRRPQVPKDLRKPTIPMEPPRAQRPAFDADTASPQPEETEITGSAYVVDGDTIVIKKTQIRLYGVDAPEMNHPYGKKAKWALVSLCKGQTICAKILETDDHGRTVARCSLPDGRDLSAEMVKLGLAIDWPKFSRGEYRSLEVPDARKKMWLADARQKGRMHVWEKFEAQQNARSTGKQRS